MKVKAISEIEIADEEMKEYILEAAREFDEHIYELLVKAPIYNDKFDAWESDLNNYLTATFDDSNDYIFADFITSISWYKGEAIVPICKKWLELCGNNKIKPLLEECVNNNVKLTWE